MLKAIEETRDKLVFELSEVQSGVSGDLSFSKKQNPLVGVHKAKIEEKVGLRLSIQLAITNLKSKMKELEGHKAKVRKEIKDWKKADSSEIGTHASESSIEQLEDEKGRVLWQLENAKEREINLKRDLKAVRMGASDCSRKEGSK